MKSKRIVDAIGNIDDELILGAERATVKAKNEYVFYESWRFVERGKILWKF